MTEPANIGRTGRVGLCRAGLGFANHVFHHLADQPAQHFMHKAGVGGIRVGLPDRIEDRGDMRNRVQFAHREGAGAKPVIQIVVVIGDVIGDGGALGLQRGEPVQPQLDLELGY